VIDILTGLFIAGIISSIAYFRHSLSLSGAIAAVMVGTIVYASGGPTMMEVLLLFFISSNVIGRVANIKKEPANRNARQVLANGLIATILAILYYFTQEDRYVLLFIISMAVATADTWSSELGILSKKPPVSLITWKQTAYGVSGSVTTIGLLASLAGAVLISAFASFQPIVIIMGFLGSIVDSLLGHFQVRYVDGTTGDVKEDPALQQGDTYLSGIRFLTNDAVNFLSHVVIIIAAYFVV
jgi:uncharacterized protein (TIGR00297 family)